jgi:beta-glucosidase
MQLRIRELGWGESCSRGVLACTGHQALAREVATRAMVLLRNERVEAAGGGRHMGGSAAPPVLPLAAAELKRLAVIGRLAAVPNTGDRGSSHVEPPYVVTPLEGLRKALDPQGVQVLYDDGADRARALEIAKASDAALVVVGYDYRDEGENMRAVFPRWLLRNLPLPSLRALPQVAALTFRSGLAMAGGSAGGDRGSLTLHAHDEDLLLAVAAANPRTVVVLMCGSAVLMERWREVVPGILILWYPGMEGGHALADIVLGKEKPTGRLPFTIPTSPEHLPPFDPKAKVVEYGALHGQALLDSLGVEAAFPYGFGLSYG